MYARSSQSWQSLSPALLLSPTIENRSKIRNHSNDSIQKLNLSPIQTSSSTTLMDFSTPLNISIKHDPIEQNSIKSKSPKKQATPTITTRRQQMLCKKKLPQNGLRRRQRMNSVENLG